jgi:hypothetical protein
MSATVVNPSTNPSTNTDAKTLFRAAYENRYTWDSSFPGYRADVTYRHGEVLYQGQAKVVPDERMGYRGEVTGIANEEVQKAVQGQLWEIAVHRVRRPFERTHDGNEFSLGDTDANGAVQVNIEGKAKGDHYRVKGNEVVKVHRHMHGTVVTIHTFSTHDTGAGYLSHTYDSVYHDPKTGDQTSEVSLFTDEYGEFGGYQILTKRTIATPDEQGQTQTLEFEFSNIELA